MTAAEILSAALNIVILVFLVSTMAGVGVSLSLRQIIEPLRNARLVISSLVASYVLVPLVAIVVARLFSLEEPLRIGLVLFSMSAGAEAGPKLAGIAKANVAYSVGLLVAQLVITVIFVPLLLTLLFPAADIDTGKLLLKLLLGVLLPLSLGLLLRARREAAADRLSPYLHRISTIFMLLMAGGLVLLNVKDIVRLAGSGAIPAATIFIAGAFLVGYLLGGPGKGNRPTLGLMSSGRNASICLVIASQVFTDPKVLVMIVATVILMLCVLLPTSLYLGRSGARRPAGFS